MSIPSNELNTYIESVYSWRGEQETKLRGETGWLTVVGLCWLHEGDNRLGSDPQGDVLLPSRLPTQLGVITLSEGATILQVTADDVSVVVDGQNVREAVLRYGDEHTTLVQINGVTFFVIRRGDRFVVRVRDVESEARRTFGGRCWFPVDTDYRLVGSFIPYPSERTIEVETVIGTTTHYSSPGVVTFEVGGVTQKLEAFEGEKGMLWFVFRDATSGKLTYGAGRFLYAPLNEDRTVDLDFNKAVHPPCAFTAYATCPLPPRQNRLHLAINAGEKSS